MGGVAESYEARAARLAAAEMALTEAELATPPRPLSAEEAAFLAAQWRNTDNLLATEEKVEAVLSWETRKGAAVESVSLGRLQAKYCRPGATPAAAECPRYIGRIPDRGSRIGHYFDTW